MAIVTPTTPTTALTRTPKFDRLAAARWLDDWHGPVTVWLDGSTLLADAQESRYRDILASLLSRGIPLRTIKRLSLDDPRLDEQVRRTRTQEYIDRRLRRATHAQ